MTGSDKQIQWATKIQAEYIREVEKWGRSNADEAAKAGQGEQWAAVIAGMVQQAQAETRAAWWIDNRAHTGFGGKVWAAHYEAAVAQVKAAA